MSLAETYSKQCSAAGQSNREIILDALSFIEHSLKQRRAVVLDLNGSRDGRRGASNELFKNRINDDDVDMIVKTLSSKNGVQLAGIDMRSNSITDKGAAILAELLKAPSKTGFKVYRVTLNANDIGPVGCQALAAEVANNKCLRILELNGNKIGKAGGMSLTKALRSNQTLTSLDIGNTDINNDVIIDLTGHLCSDTSLRMLNLDNPLFDNRANSSVVPLQHIGKMLRVNGGLQTLHISKMRIRDEEAEVLASYLIENTKLKHLDLSVNKIGPVGAAAFARLLVKGSTLETLNLSANSIQDKGAMAFAAALVQNVNLQRLDVAGSKIGDSGLFGLAESLRKNTKLREMACWGNTFGVRSSDSFYDYKEEFDTSAIQLDFRPYKVDGIVHVACLSANRK